MTEVVPDGTRGGIGSPASGGVDGGSTRDQGAGPTGQFDVVIIGGGPGGYATALYGAAAGLSVAMVELDKVGGTCLHRGCVPAKEFLETAAVFRTVRRLEPVRHHRRLGPTHRPGGRLLGQPGPQAAGRRPAVQGAGRPAEGPRGHRRSTAAAPCCAGHRVQIAGNDGSTTEITGTDVVLAAGSVPRTIPGFDIDGSLVLTSDEVLALDELPASVAVIGGGAIGCEFASMFADLGCTVTVFEALPEHPHRLRRGRGEDGGPLLPEAGHRREGRRPAAGPHPGSLGHGAPWSPTTTARSWPSTPWWSRWAAAPGPRAWWPRAPAWWSTSGASWSPTATMRTGADGVWAVGDVVAGTPQLAHVGFAEGIVVIKGILGEPVVAGRLRPGARGPSTATPRWPSPA